MRNKIKIFAVVFSMFFATISFAQLVDPGGDGSGPDDSGIAGQGVGGGGAPIGSGMLILAGLGLAYAGRKTLILNKEEK